jgi:hypothetical protein
LLLATISANPANPLPPVVSFVSRLQTRTFVGFNLGFFSGKAEKDEEAEGLPEMKFCTMFYDKGITGAVDGYRLPEKSHDDELRTQYALSDENIVYYEAVLLNADSGFTVEFFMKPWGL